MNQNKHVDPINPLAVLTPDELDRARVSSEAQASALVARYEEMLRAAPSSPTAVRVDPKMMFRR